MAKGAGLLPPKCHPMAMIMLMIILVLMLVMMLVLISMPMLMTMLMLVHKSSLCCHCDKSEDQIPPQADVRSSRSSEHQPWLSELVPYKWCGRCNNTPSCAKQSQQHTIESVKVFGDGNISSRSTCRGCDIIDPRWKMNDESKHLYKPRVIHLPSATNRYEHMLRRKHDCSQRVGTELSKCTSSDFDQIQAA